jgi:cell division protein FtsB
VNTQILIVLAVGLFALTVLAGVGLLVIARLRRSIKAQFDTLENLLRTVQASQPHSDPGEPSYPRHGDISG